MRKKKLAGLALACALLLAGCAKGENAPAAYDPAATAKALTDSAAFSQDLEKLEADLVAVYYGLETEPEESAAYTSLEGGYEGLAVLKMADEEGAKAALEALRAHVDDQVEAEKDQQYKPEDVPKLEGAVLRQAGDTVLLVVAADYGAVETALEGLA